MRGFFVGGHWWDVTKEDSEAIKGAAESLAVAGIDKAIQEAQLLWAAAMPNRYENPAELVSGDVVRAFQALVERRSAREPLSHLIGYRDFYKHRFAVSSDVLDPRPETETLIEQALDGPFESVLDLGTGSGCILLSLLAERAGARGVGTDVSAAALTIAQRNVAKLELDHRTTLLQSDWYSAVTGSFDLIVSNPPYIAIDEMAGLQPEVRNHEPRMALTDEGDGLACYRTIVAGAPSHLVAGGRLIVEIGPTQAKAVSAMMADAGFADIHVTLDIDGRDRVVAARFLAE